MNQKLMDLELEILHSIPTSGTSRPHAYATWVGRDGRIEMGPVRWRSARTEAERAWTGDDSAWQYSCSPFPGAWSNHVRESEILRVRDLGAMSLAGMTCVCRGTEYDRPCPAPDCKTPARSF